MSCDHNTHDAARCKVCGAHVRRPGNEYAPLFCGKRCWRIQLERDRDAAFGPNRDRFDSEGTR